MIFIIYALIVFLFGSIPTGYIIGKKAAGVDIRKLGSGNIGSTNVKRILGKKAAVITQVIDMAKGLVPVLIAKYTYQYINVPFSKEEFISLLAIIVIIGHDFTPFLNFKGGKGVNTTAAAFLAVAPIPTLMAGAVYIFMKFFTNIVSIKSLTIALVITIASILLGYDISIILSAAAAELLIIIRHKENIKRLIMKQES
ncbi:glycerol-3-phosphate 1-O-acyltransferase PlsY [Clostridium sp. 19966]|nr:glycerol-3-phosphate 1-O-acyltransferase PlsY [Clostridium sp. 19966]